MNHIKNFFGKNKVYLICYFLILVIVSILLLIVPKATIHLTINQYNSEIADLFFKYITHLGDGWVPVIISIAFLFFSFRYAIIIGLSSSISGLLAQFFKRLIFHDVARPVKYLADFQLHLVDGVKMYTSFSFPSGHSTSIFTLCMCLAAISSSMLTKIVLLCIAVLVAFSRVYLSQHFLIDIYAGSMIGTFTAIIIVYYMSGLKAAWLDKSLLSIRRSKVE